jgi:hypothetical protein
MESYVLDRRLRLGIRKVLRLGLLGLGIMALALIDKDK